MAFKHNYISDISSKKPLLFKRRLNVGSWHWSKIAAPFDLFATRGSCFIFSPFLFNIIYNEIVPFYSAFHHLNGEEFCEPSEELFSKVIIAQKM